jgi:thiosulfate/3-mercaptopyruvate sulfurtransferase
LQATTTLVAYDNNGGQFAARLWWLARWIGHDAVQVLDGGVTAWTAAGGALETGSSPGKIHRAAITTNSLPVLVKMPTVDVDFLIANLETSRVVVVDARAAPRFRGEVEPIDPVAGHIPHALNRPCSQNLGVDGCFKPADQLRREFLEMLGERKSQEIVHQCGSGVTACHNLLAMEVAGLCGSALYPGSWSEWVSDASRPVQTQHA